MLRKIVLAMVLMVMIGGLAYGTETEGPKITLEEQKGGTENGGPSNGVEPRAAGQSAECEGNKGYHQSAKISTESGDEEIGTYRREKRKISATEQTASRSGDRTSSVVSAGTYTITAYTAGYESTGKSPGHPAYGVTASGAKVRKNHTVAADWDLLPPGTKLMIEGLEHIYTVEDRGSAVKGKHIDLYIPCLDEALQWGVRERKVTIIEMGGK